ncbi:branched-chain amino acid aminotransferase [Thermotomaculum hydrothermale]|uniref:Branched-chain-amino-acid aminotransferase n=1 Tax=Thermotomaculum hydrothermale TaxID=981385 RepID=A0A7R6SY86_9BACT|nr:branched-chain-amino-acid transaminase [Thermotomaculum hydrothermale]BBB32365.1 branched-chain amino acid aminotransferase [Thermotomaculum hydrothermale]
MALSVYLDGKWVSSREEALVPVFDHGLLYGDGIFEGIRAYNGLVFRLEDHIDRLYNSAKGISLEIPVSKKEMIDLVLESARRTGLDDCYIRLLVTRGVGDLGIDPRKCAKPSIYIIATGIALYPEDRYEKGLDVVVVSTRRVRPDMLNPMFKSLNYLNNILGKIEANRMGADEGIMLNAEGYVTECTADNIFAVKNGELYTPPVYHGILEGITRKVIMEIAREHDIPVHEQGMVVQSFLSADEVFLTGSGAELIPVVTIDGKPVNDGKPGQVFKQLREWFKERTKYDGIPFK